MIARYLNATPTIEVDLKPQLASLYGESSMGPLGHLSVGLAEKPAASKVSFGVLLLATWILDVFATGTGFTGIERAQIGNPWSHGLFMSVVWSVAFGLLANRLYRDYRAGVVVGSLAARGFGRTTCTELSR